MAGSRRATLKDVARLSDVSPATVSYVLNRKSGKTISAATIQRVLRAAKSLNYVPNSAAAALRRGHANIVLVVTEPSHTGDVSERLLSKIADAISGQGYSVMVHTMRSEDDLLAIANSIHPYGIWANAALTDSTVSTLRSYGVQRIRRSPEAPNTTVSKPWEHAIGEAQGVFLIESGYECVIGFTPSASARGPVYEARLQGLRSACKAHDRPTPLIVTSTLDRAEIASHIQSLDLSTKTAIAAVDDRAALGILAALADLNLRAPDNLGVIGADNTVESSFGIPPLTTVEFDVTLFAEAAMTWLSEPAGQQESNNKADEFTQSVRIRNRSST